MQRIRIIYGVILFTCLILLPLMLIGNTNLRHAVAPIRPAVTGSESIADGDPVPPPPKKPSISSSSTLVADGDPVPPPPKKPASSSVTLIADGDPVPPPPKKPAGLVVFLTV